MKEEVLATCVKNFVSSACSEHVRLDGRHFDAYRPIDVVFGKEWGSCYVSFGETKVLATVTCDVQLPKTTRPNEGLLHVNVELGPMAAAHIEAGPPTDLSTHLNRMLDKFLKESRCVDLESLCIVAEEKVWNVRVDVNILNCDGNLIGCCSAAALAALMHFRRPDFTLSGEVVTIHSTAERDPLPISLHHHPIAIAFAIFNNGDQVLVDPTWTEERVSQAQLVMAVNTYRELCGLHLSGTARAAPHIILQCASKAATFAAVIIANIRQALDDDLKTRSEGTVPGLSQCIKLDRVLASSMDRSTLHLADSGETRPRPRPRPMEVEEVKKGDSSSDDEVQIISVGEKTAELRPGKNKPPLKDEVLKSWEPSTEGNKWISETKESYNSEEDEDDDDDDDEDDEEEDDEGSDSDVEVIKEITAEDRVIDKIELSGDSEEEETVVLKTSDLNNG